ncbi:MAG: hypothetical protein KBT03_09485 [Bacteroidales bacterium]|nr:hypothetical protein [Candidatus Scybalousia scybalohippi]
MRIISSITENPFQTFYFYTEEGEEIKFSLRFLPTQKSWILNVVCDNMKVDGIKVCRSGNILDKFHNIINFGVAILTESGEDPFQITDFADGTAQFCVLNRDELKEVTGALDG